MNFDRGHGSKSRAHLLNFPVSCLLEQELDQGHIDGDGNRDLLLGKKKNILSNESMSKDWERSKAEKPWTTRVSALYRTSA